ncbi:LysM peptidoglycan-binding domain-containing protein [Chryseobacterium sp. Tr-659]|uniref:LysM peptidoglycan-binding domain-containing protein n=1 Tax=Chryseobacterium sp. Tr-659 TaxID=2608340 RepID=UPI0014237760|nr:LysM domain-containing protein [Chryseobacterium sp. Tr-659]NIF06603.1 LysM peptidoglycan-binding domain-containing protein [Chryseobacterium sp. Tr-659]
MSLSKLAATFRSQAAANNNNITINVASFTDSDLIPQVGLNDLLSKSYKLPTDSYLLIDVSGTSIPEPVGNTLTISSATAAILNVEKSNTSVTLIVTANDADEVQFTIQINLSNWIFATSWPYMKGGVFDNLPYTSPSFIFSTQAVSAFNWQKKSISLTEGQNFAALITLTKWLQPVVNFFTSWTSSTQLALVGSIDPSQVNNEDIVYPELDLFVNIDATLISLGFLKVSNPGVGFQIKTEEETVTTEPEDEGDALRIEYETDDGLMLAEEETQKVQTPILYFRLLLAAGDAIVLNFSAAVESGSSSFLLNVAAEPDKPLTPLNLFGLMAGQNWFQNIPPTLQQFLNSIAFKGFNTSLDFSNGLSINSVSAYIGSNGAWTLFDNFVIEQFDVNWVIIDPGTTNSQSLYFSARVNFFPTLFVGGFDVEITSGLNLSAAFTGSVTFNNLLSAITAGAITIPENLLLVEFTAFGINMDINSKYYEFYANANIDLNFITNVSVTDGTLRLTSSSPASGTGPSIFTAQVSGLFAIGSLQLNTDVNYNSSDGWDLSIAMPEGSNLNLGELIKQLFETISLPTSFLPDSLNITQFSLSATIPSGTGQSSYEVKGGLQWIFTFPIIDQKINIIANLWLKYEAASNNSGTGKYSGGVLGSVTLEYFNATVDISYNFSENNQQLAITWEGFTAMYDVSGQSRTIVFSIKNWTLGGLITSFMKMLFNPTFELDAPWDILNKISLDGFSVTYNLDTKDIKVTYKLPKTLNLVFININGINLTKTQKGVFITFDGNSVVPSINESNLFKPASGGQDIQKMPDVPGQGNQYFDLRLLAMGQHVELANPAQYNSIKDVTKAMQEAFAEPKPGTVPIGPGSGNTLLKFNEDSNWLIATNFGILNAGTKDKPVWTLDMQVVFNDPNLYGLRIAMAGGKAKIFEGLDFEIMYKKISDSIGVYQMDLTLPNALRYLQFGAVNITLPSIGIEIYTNGDFTVDIGFPYNMDFSRSFTVQAIVPPGIPAMGSGGFYFGKLSSATTNKVPKTNYGNFNPVIVFGIGLQVGVGYSVNYGILSAGFSVTMFGIIEGVIAAYYPYSGTLQESNKEQVETSYYYYLQGTIGIIGKLYGSIDFGIISASVNITVMVYAQATFEAYNKIPLAIVASVDVRVSAKLNLGIFSITIHFTFTARIRFDLTIGTDQTAKAPWNNNLQAPQAAARLSAPAATVRVAPARIATPLDGTIPVTFAAIDGVESTEETISDVMVIRRSPHMPMNYHSVLTETSSDTLPTLSLYFVPHLTVAGPENGNLKDQSAQYVATLFIDAPDPSGNGNETTTSFEYLCSDFFRWLMLNYIDHTPSQSFRTEVDTEGISKADLDALITFLSSENNPFPIPTSDLLNFLQNSFQAVNVQLLQGDLSAAAIFPMFFDLDLKVPDISLDIQFNNYNMATQEYLSAVKEWFNELAVKVQEETASAAKLAVAADPQQWSMSTFVFEDYFVLLGKQLAGYASDAMDNFTYRLNNGNSFSAMINWANGITVDGTGNKVTVQDIATANQTHPLTGNKPIIITGVMYDIVESDTFTSVAAIYAITANMLISENAAVPGLLAPQTITYKGNSYNVQATDTINTIAAGLKTTVDDLAADTNFQNTAILTIGSWLIIGAAIYTAKNEDTFNSISTDVYKNIEVCTLLMQNQITPGLFIAGNSFEYNTTQYTIVPGDTLTSMATAISALTGTTVTPQDLACNAQVQAQQVQPLGQVLVQPFIHTTATFTDAAQADTLDTLAQQYNTTAALLATNYANQQQDNFFYNGDGYTNANIPGLQYLTIGSILEYFTDNNSYGQLSGMVSRYQLHGMRLPTNLPGLTLSAGSSCTGSNCALYALTGQEFALPNPIPDDFSIQLINNSLNWLQFDGKTIQEGGSTLDIKLTTEDINQINTLLTYAQNTGIKPDVLELTPMQPFNLQQVQYTFQTTTQWQTSGALKLPYGSPEAQSNVSPLIWQFPSGLLNQLALPKEQGSAFSIQIGQYDAAKGVMDYRPSSYYGWSTMVDIEIKLLDTDSTAPVNAYSYELLGAGEAGATILQRLLLALDPKSAGNNMDKIVDIQWLYEGSDGLLSVGMEHMKTFIVQANLSTETNPDTSALIMAERMATEAAPTTGILNSIYDFIRLLWECSITRSGGYYLMYNETEGNTGFPSSVFGKGDTANVRLLVTYSSQYNNKPSDYMTCAVTGDKIDSNSCVVYAQSEMQQGLSYYVNTPDDTIDAITARFNILPAELVELNKKVTLNTKADINDPGKYPVPAITFNGLVCEVGTNGPGNTLSSIAAYYGADATAIQQLNPGISDWNNLPLWQLVILPQIQYTISTSGKAGITFESIAAYYFIDMAAMAWAARDVVNIFVNPTTLTINDQILHKVASVQQGTAGFDLNRTNPNPDPDKQPKITDPNYAEVYLNNMYNLLSYQIVENSWFTESIVGLPAGPAKPQTQDDVLGKTDNSDGQDDLIWYYNQVVPIAKFARSNPFMNYPAGYPQEDDNPYRGIGHHVQVHFDWVDYYGNITVTPFSDPQLDSSTPVNNPPIQTGYVDELKGLGKWPSVELSYLFDLDTSNQPELKLEFNFNTQRYNELPDVPADQQQDWKQNAANDLLTYTNVYYQLTQLNPVDGRNTLTATLSTSLTPDKAVDLSGDQFNQLLQFVKDIYTYLSARSLGNQAPAPVMNPLTSSINAADIDTHSILQLTVNLDFYRDLQYVNTDFKDSTLVTQALTQVKPKTMSTTVQTDSDPQYSLNEFAALFEAAFLSAGNYELKIAIGTNAATAGGTNSQAVFVVRMGLRSGQGIYWQVNQAGTYQLTTDSITQLTADGVPTDVTAAINSLVGTLYDSRDLFDTALQQQLTAAQFNQYRISIYTYSLLNAVFYAPKPLATSLVSKSDVPLCSYITGKGLDCSKGEIQNFTGIDMDTWGAQSLNAIDVFLSADYAVPAFLVDQLQSDEEKKWLTAQGIDATTYLQAITNAKTTLAGAIASEIEPILTAPYVSSASGDNTSLGNAKEKFEQQLLNQLGNAYTVNALVQFEVTAESDFVASGSYQTPPRLYGTPVINNKADGEAKEYSISTSKIQLNEKGTTDTDSFLTFSFTTKNAKEFTSVDLDMTYVVTHVECDISEVTGIKGYQGSNWLTFIIPADVSSNGNTPNAASLQQSLGNVDIPVVLRNYPTPPTLTTQTGKGVSVEGDTTKIRLAKASEWDFTYSYTEDQAAQDKIFSDIEFNMIPDASSKRLTTTSRDLFSDLAQFVTVWPQVLDDFNRYLKLITAKSDNSDPNLANAYYALQTMVTLTNNLAIAWSQFNSLLFGNPYGNAAIRAYDFIIRQTDDIDFDNRLLVTIIPSADMSADDLSLYRGTKNVLETDIPQTPYVTIDNYTKVNATDKNGNPIPDAYWYQAGDNTYLSWEESFNIPSRTVNVDALNILQFQYAWAGLSIIRNEDLVPYNPTVNDFIYRTPLVRFSNKLIPLLSSDSTFDIARINNDTGLNLPLAQQLANFFSTFFTYDELKEQLVKLSVSWNYPLLAVSDDVMPAIELPVLLAAPFTFEIPADYEIPAGGCQPSFNESDPFVCRLANTLKMWYSQHNPVTNGAWLQIDIAVFSSLSESKLPLIELKNVILYYKNITDMNV